MAEKSDEELMEAYQMGSELAFDALFQRHSGRLFGFLSKRIQNKGNAKDLLQEVFFKLHRSRHLYNPPLPFSPWLFSITRSVLLDHYKKTKRQGRFTELVDFDQVAAPSPSEDHSIDKAVLNSLLGAQRTAVQLRIYDDATFEEIASRLSTSPENARQLVSRGLRRLKQLWAKKERS